MAASCLFCAANESSVNINATRVEEKASSVALCPMYEVPEKGNLLGQELKTKLFHVDKQFGKLMDSVSLVTDRFFYCSAQQDRLRQIYVAKFNKATDRISSTKQTRFRKSQI